MEIRKANIADISVISRLMEAYYKEDGYSFNKEKATSNLEQFIANSYLGQIFVAILEDNICGYVIITNGYSFEYGGKDAFVDELFVVNEFRGKNIGRSLLNEAISFCHSNGTKAIHLEVEKYKPTTQQMYLNSGFIEHNRTLMTLTFTSDIS